MCDTMVALTDAGVLFAKNSDRDPNEAQLIEWLPSGDHAPRATVVCTWTEIPQVGHTHAVVISRPWWMWGAEIGANEHGVVIGNEAVFTNQPAGDPGLLGMDLLRLALERAATAADAVAVIVDLLERHGQGGPCSYEHPKFSYHNSFLVADPSGAMVLETAGRRWATEEVRGRARSISNGLTIQPFAEAHSDAMRSRLSSCALRRSRTQTAAGRALGPADLMAALRDHGGSPTPTWRLVNGAMSGPCVHAGGLAISTQTTASWVADLRRAPVHWVTATSAPCTSLFKPISVDQPVDTGPAPTNMWDPVTLWWRHERLHRATVADHGALLARYRHARDRTEAMWLAERPAGDAAFREADRLEAAWTADVLGASVTDRRPLPVRRSWRKLDAAARIADGATTTDAAPAVTDRAADASATAA